MITVKNAAKAYDGQFVLEGVNWHINQGEWWGIIGPNGSGKSTLLHLISGTEKLTNGDISIQGKPISNYSRKELSRIVAVLQQDGVPQIHFPVRDVIEMGRFPYQDWLGREQQGYEEKDQLLNEIMSKLELDSIADRSVDELSGGQRQRVALGKVMAQEPQVLLLDEPTTYLDIRYQLQFMELVQKWRMDNGLTIIAVLHDLNLAAQFCDKLLVLKDGKAVSSGTPAEILTRDNIHSVFKVNPAIVAHPDSGVPQLLLKRKL
ncbi:ABC transporter ATP-binding protein [Paenibacillus sediminis]|uniref:Iron complex transport system ATP-binding protein n=1 Tax=Paenibacillus sediminis TaxID=664909 RepID=A0ABS4H4J2_9BACL|nr:ABC transporter ATP-binding protein [Paenibacillus sediminis]MBP1937460.1 iron complex transport system ATP-binding protein [Paenibacillus sediminis]